MQILNSKRFATSRKNKDGTLITLPESAKRDAVASTGVLAADQGQDKPLRFVCSDETVDRYNSTIAADGWDLVAFKKNPLMLFNHNGDVPVGRWLSMGVEGKQLMGEAEFMPRDLSEFAWMIGEMYRKGYLRAVSVNFLPIEYKFNDERGWFAIDYLKQELLECSAVSLPGQANALIVESDEEDDTERAFSAAPFEGFACQSAEYKRLMRGLVERSLAGDPKAPLPKDAALYLRSALGGRIQAPVPAAPVAPPAPVEPTRAAEPAPAPVPAPVVREAPPATPPEPVTPAPVPTVDPVAQRLDAIEKSVASIATLLAPVAEERAHKAHRLSASNLKAIKAARKACDDTLARHSAAEGTDEGEPDGEAEPDGDEAQAKSAPVAPAPPAVRETPKTDPVTPAPTPAPAPHSDVLETLRQSRRERAEAEMSLTGKVPPLP